MDLKWQEMPSKVNFGHPKWPIDLKWPEMRSKVNFGYPKMSNKNKVAYRSDLGFPKWPTQPLCKKCQNNVAYRSEMARNAIEGEFRTSKMGAGSNFVKNK